MFTKPLKFNDFQTDNSVGLRWTECTGLSWTESYGVSWTECTGDRTTKLVLRCHENSVRPCEAEYKSIYTINLNQKQCRLRKSLRINQGKVRDREIRLTIDYLSKLRKKETLTPHAKTSKRFIP